MENMTEHQKKEIEYFERHLEKVKLMHDPKKTTRPWVAEMYIKHAEDMLEAVKNGKSPYNLADRE